jgi:hypothetical protein
MTCWISILRLQKSIANTFKSHYLIEICGYRSVRKRKPEVHMHPALSSITINAHVRDLQRAMHPERTKRPRRPRLARIRPSR